ncbi:MAG TPA: DUF6766 family protein [Polyangiales bacterium]
MTALGWPPGEHGFARFLRENGLSIAALSLFVLSLVGQAICGYRVTNEERREHQQAELGFAAYLASGDFVEATFENWESEFLQMALFVMLTRFLRQKGSSESKKLDQEEAVDRDPRADVRPDSPWPVRRGGVVLALYQRSLFVSLMLLFALSFALHGVGGALKHNQEAARHGGASESVLSYFATADFWFESFQNWQSEFLSMAALVLLSIVLREQGSPQSKPVAAPHSETGES